jgi:chaperone modulatory protein CbpM
MIKRDENELTGEIFDETTEITVIELCEFCSIERTMVEQMIEEGILDPLEGARDEPRFPYSSVRRTLTVVHLQRDLGVNLPGAALALDLLDRIEKLRARSHWSR